ncbi:MAG: ribosome small subunit-dependent GTPase A [Gemmatimonadota bacterium]
MVTVKGTVLAREGASYRVATADGEVRAVLRGRVKRDEPRVVVGDDVELDCGDQENSGESSGVEISCGIVSVGERRTLLERRMPHGRGAKPIAANIDEVLVVTAARDPAPIPQLLDRLLVIAEVNNLPAAVLLNKTDLDSGGAVEQRFRQAGYPVFRASVKAGQGVEEIRNHLAGRTTVLTGPSGAGKSSLVNALEPGLKLRVGEISERSRRGTQTTVSAVMIPLKAGGYLVDTPGFSEVGLWGVVPREMASCFPEMRPLIDQCKYADCKHLIEPGCAVLAAVKRGDVAADRWESYRRLLEETEGEPKEWE